MTKRIYYGENLTILKQLGDSSADLIYIKPPNEINSLNILPEELERPFSLGSKQYTNLYDEYLLYLEPRLIEAYRILSERGTLYLHSNYNRSHYIKALILDPIFERDNFINEIVWAREGNGGGGHAWPSKHEIILMYGKTPDFKFNSNDIDRIDYLAPNLVGKEKNELGKLPTDTWWYTQKISEKEILKRIILASSDEGDSVVDFFAGSGLTGEVCIALGRNFTLVEENFQQIKEMAKKFKDQDIEWLNFDPASL